MKRGVDEACHQVKSYDFTIGCLQSSLSRGSEGAEEEEEEEEEAGLGATRDSGVDEEIGTSMCCVLQGAERVFPSAGTGAGGKHNSNNGATIGSKISNASSNGAQDLPLESLWAAGLDEGMGFPQRCSYANHHSASLISSTTGHSNTYPEELWRERNHATYRYITLSCWISRYGCHTRKPIYETRYSANAKFSKTCSRVSGCDVGAP